MTDYTSTGSHAGTTQGNGSTLEGGLTGAAGQAAAGLMAQMKSRASSQVAAQQVRAADGLGTVANALRKAGNELRSHNESLASYADMAVDELEHISTRIREKSPGEYLDDLEHFARHRPAAFVGGTFLLGLALARFLKSTQPRRARAYPDNGNVQGTRGYDRQPGYDASRETSSATDRWPESTGSVTPPAPPGRTHASASSATDLTARQGAGEPSSPTGTSSTSGTSATNRDRGTGERP
jgi:hypothetical protein